MSDDITALLQRAAQWEPAADPVQTMRQRIHRSQRRRGLVAVLGAAVATAAIPLGLGLVTGTDPSLPPAAAPIKASATKAGIRLDLTLSGATLLSGEPITVTAEVANTSREPLTLTVGPMGCGPEPAVVADYRPLLAPRESLRAGSRAREYAARFGAPQHRRLSLLDAAGACPGPQRLRVLAPGEVLRREAVWVPRTPAGATTGTEVPVSGAVSFFRPSETTGSSALLQVADELVAHLRVPLRGGDDDQLPLPDVVESAVSDARFRAVLDAAAPASWRAGWVLPAGSQPAAGDTPDEALQRVLTAADEWEVVLVHDADGRLMRTTARVDGGTGAVQEVVTRPHA